MTKHHFEFDRIWPKRSLHLKIDERGFAFCELPNCKKNNCGHLKNAFKNEKIKNEIKSRGIYVSQVFLNDLYK